MPLQQGIESGTGEAGDGAGFVQGGGNSHEFFQVPLFQFGHGLLAEIDEGGQSCGADVGSGQDRAGGWW